MYDRHAKYNKTIKHLLNDDFYLDIQDRKLDRLESKSKLYNNQIEDIEDIDNIDYINCINNIYDINDIYSQQAILSNKLTKYKQKKEYNKKNIKYISKNLEKDMSDNDYNRFEKEQWMVKHQYMYEYEFTQLLHEIKDYVPLLIEGKTDFLKLQGYTIDPKLSYFDNKNKIIIYG
jgi:hypothetical protein